MPPIEGGYFSYLPDEMVTYILDKDLMKIIKMSNTSKAITAKLEGWWTLAHASGL